MTSERKSLDGVYAIDRVANLGAYAGLSPHFPAAVDWLLAHDLAALPAGRIELADGAVAVIVNDAAELKPFGERRPEVHRAFFDIQIPLSGAETFGLARHDPAAAGAFDEARDIGFYDEPVEPFTLVPGEMAILFPKTCAHAPACTVDGAKTVRKIVVKVRA